MMCVIAVQLRRLILSLLGLIDGIYTDTRWAVAVYDSSVDCSSSHWEDSIGRGRKIEDVLLER